MAAQEFEVITQYFRESGLDFPRSGIDLGNGDDGAILTVPSGQQLVLSTDLLQEGIHFPLQAIPELIANRALAVNLSDLAAMGADPLCFTLGLSLPHNDAAWLEAFSLGLLKLARQHECPLIGGDLIRGNLHLAIQICGLVPRDRALLRSGARAGHLVYVSGTLGDAAAALALFRSTASSQKVPETESVFVPKKLKERQRDHFINAFYKPVPRIELGILLRDLASAAIDISDGLLADLQHILDASGVGAEIDVDQIPLSAAMTSCVVEEKRLPLALSGGDDYELCFAVPPENCIRLEELTQSLGLPVKRIGEIVTGESLVCLDSYGESVAFSDKGFDHFMQE